MKKNIYFLAGMLSFGALFTGCDDDDFGKAVTITVKKDFINILTEKVRIIIKYYA